MRRVAAWILILVGAALAVAGAAIVFSEPRRSLLAAGGAAIALGLAVLACGIVVRPGRRAQRATEWHFAPRR